MKYFNLQTRSSSLAIVASCGSAAGSRKAVGKSRKLPRSSFSKQSLRRMVAKGELRDEVGEALSASRDDDEQLEQRLIDLAFGKFDPELAPEDDPSTSAYYDGRDELERGSSDPFDCHLDDDCKPLDDDSDELERDDYCCDDDDCEPLDDGSCYYYDFAPRFAHRFGIAYGPSNDHCDAGKVFGADGEEPKDRFEYEDPDLPEPVFERPRKVAGRIERSSQEIETLKVRVRAGLLPVKTSAV